MSDKVLIILLTLAAITTTAALVACVAGVLRRMTGAPVPTAVITAGAAFGGTVALLLSTAVAVGLL